MADTCCEVTWLLALLKELHVTNLTPVAFHCDNKSAIHIANNPVFHERTKHIEIDCHIVRQKMIQGITSIVHIPTKVQPADLFTKALASDHLMSLLSKLGACNLFQASNLRGDVTYKDDINTISKGQACNLSI